MRFIQIQLEWVSQHPQQPFSGDLAGEVQAGLGRPLPELCIPSLRPQLLFWAMQSVEKPQEERPVTRQPGPRTGLPATSSPCSPLWAQQPPVTAKARAACVMYSYCGFITTKVCQQAGCDGIVLPPASARRQREKQFRREFGGSWVLLKLRSLRGRPCMVSVHVVLWGLLSQSFIPDSVSWGEKIC